MAAEDGSITTKELLVGLRLGRPCDRAVCGAVVLGTAAYLARWPKACFTEEGELRPFKKLSAEPDATYKHFLLVPLTAAVVFYLFT